MGRLRAARAASACSIAAFAALPARKPPALALPEPALAPGRRVLVVDKPERTQTQILIGTLGTSAHDRDTCR